MSLVQQPVFEMTLAEYFRERLEELGRRMAPPPHEDTLWYTANMLARFGDSDQLFSYDHGEVDIRPLALLYKDAHEAEDMRQRCLILRQLGDSALFLGALFPEKFERRGILRDYFVGMGGGAYDYLSENARHNRHIFSELAAMFARMLDLVARACARQKLFDAADVLNLYQRWRQTRDPHLARQLRDLGINLPESDVLH
ncbi:hypothetical protein OQJ46_09945 [Microbulbifer thermotolerans]|uniref:hypothetical protein n=1 Tax=Microbulbifer thermotolerans TaxID=252514 RepID=UPI00224B6F21|nr:hypothetical protein [Microbulbifer thermotolerans]MCX2783309.1 hypothetical protein [Microbulbifer thermotolerans]MCX2834076.1 hypothetical protein [Microbulbifer thermotolerans]MCX2840559.1 hypothetical protein [Microbulbifer thermotolerans]